MSERLAAAEAQAKAAQSKLAAAKAQDDMPDAAPTPKVQEERDMANGVDDENDDGSASYGDLTDPSTDSDRFDNDVSTGADAPQNDFPAPADPPLAGDIRPDDRPNDQ